jgi:hypothetical protein
MRLFILTVVIGLMGASGVWADSWVAPAATTYESTNKDYRFTTTPGQRFGATPEELASLSESLRRVGRAADARKLKEAANAAKDIPPCKGRLERKVKEGKYEAVWQRDLSNDVAPVDVLVSDNGKYVVTLDNWHKVGRGPNVVVIYGPQGKLVRQLALEDFLAREQVSKLRVSVSSTWWGSGHYLDEKQECVVLRIDLDKIDLERNGMIAGKTSCIQEVRLQLASGEIVENKAPGKAPASTQSDRRTTSSP